jgi:hypothetical protein
VPRIAPTFALHAAPNRWSPLASAARCAALTGDSLSVDARASAEPQLIGSDAPTPRGSQPMMSNRALRLSGKPIAVSRANCTPDEPGPPGFTRIVPIRLDGCLAGSRNRASVICLPFGSE